MKKIIISLSCISTFLAGCTTSEIDVVNSVDEPEDKQTEEVEIESEELNFTDFDDEEFLQYVQDNIYANAENDLESDDFQIESVNAIYYSKEYIEEMAYNSKSNIYFGYTEEELNEQFSGSKYVFTLGNDGGTTVEEFEGYVNPYDTIIKNTLVGSGVILICVVGRYVSKKVGAPIMVTHIFVGAADNAITFAKGSAIFGGVSSAILKGLETGNLEESIKSGVTGASEGLKWGAIAGAVIGSVTGAVSTLTAKIPTPRESEQVALEKYGGEEQIPFLDGKVVSQNTKGSTRPDVVIKKVDGTVEAIEVKNYDIVNNYSNLVRELKRQVSSRVTNLPEGSTQKICLDVTGRNYSVKYLSAIKESLQQQLSSIYPNIPIEFIGA